MKKLTRNILFFTLILSILCSSINYIKMFAANDEANNSNMIDSYIDKSETSMLSDVDISIKKITDIPNGKRIIYEVTNNGTLTICDWSIAFEADYTIIDTSGISLLSNDEVKILASAEINSIIKPSEIKNFSVDIMGNPNIELETVYRIYGFYEKDEEISDNNKKEALDYVTYNSQTGKTDFNIVNEEDIENINTQTYSNSSGSSKQILINKNFLPPTDLTSPLTVIGSDNRVKISSSNVSSAPYKCIALLILKFPNGDVCVETGFMVSDYSLLTAAHNLYDSDRGGRVQSVTAYFGVYGINYNIRATALTWSYPSAYVSSPSDKTNDWGAVTLKTAVGNTTGWFSVGYPTDNTLEEATIYVTGFPFAKATQNSQGIENYAWYMYRGSSGIASKTTNLLYYTADTQTGNSGSPIYNTNSWIVYGIHVAGSSTQNVGRRITRTLYNTFLSSGWIDE